MNGEVFKAWVEKVFIPAVRARTSDRVVLVVDNLSSHEAVDHDKVEFITLPPNTTAISQPLDAGVIETLKRRYKRRFSQANRADVCNSWKKPVHFAAHCAEPYRPRERCQPPAGAHSIANGNINEDEETEGPAVDVNGSKTA